MDGLYQSDRMHVLLSSKQIFLYKEFIIGEETGRKTTADKVVEKIFPPKDYLTCEQITAALSQMAKQYQTGKLTKSTQKDK